MQMSIETIIARANGVVALANALGITKGAVSQWERVPIGRVKDVERITGIDRALIRPDVYGDHESKKQEAA